MKRPLALEGQRNHLVLNENISGGLEIWLSGRPLAHNIILCAVPALKVSNNNDKKWRRKRKRVTKAVKAEKKIENGVLKKSISYCLVI